MASTSRCWRRVLYERQSVFDLSWWLLRRLGGLVSGPDIRRWHSGSGGAREREVAMTAALITPLMAPASLTLLFPPDLEEATNNNDKRGNDNDKMLNIFDHDVGFKIRLWSINIPLWSCLKPINALSYKSILPIHTSDMHSFREGFKRPF